MIYCVEFFFSNLNRLIIDGLPAIKAARGEWQAAARTQVSTLLSSFNLPVSGVVQYVRGLYTSEGRYKAEVGLDCVEAAVAVRKKFFTFVRPNRPEPMPDFLRGISINPSYTDGTRIRVAIMRVKAYLFRVISLIFL